MVNQPAAADSRLGGVERGVTPAARGRSGPCLEGLGSRRTEPDERTEWIDGRIARRGIAKQLREQNIGLTIGDATEAGHEHLHQTRCLKECRRPPSSNRQRAVELAVATRHVAGIVGGQCHGIGLLHAGESAARIAPHQTAVDLGQRGRRRLRITRRSQTLGLETEERCPQHREGGPRPLRTAADRWRHTPRARSKVGRGRQPKGLLERPGVAIVSGGVGGLFEVAGGRRRLVAVERDAAQHDQPP